LSRRIKLDDLAQRLGMSKFSVSRALSGKPGVSQKTRESVIRLAREIGYDHAGVNDRLGERVIHLIIPSADAIKSSFWVEVIGGADAEARLLGYRLSTNVLSDGLAPNGIDDAAAGLILAGRRSRGVLEPFMRLPNPKLLIGHPRPMEMIDSCQQANFDSGYAVGDLFGRYGHRSVAYFTDAPDDEGRNLRYAGLKEAMRQHGGEVTVVATDEDKDAKQTVLEAFETDPLPTAFACATDFVAMTLAWGLNELGLKIPAHVSLVGSNDTHTASMLGLRLTTVRPPMREIGAIAVQMLHWRMNLAPPDARPRRTLLTPELVERSTHGPANGNELRARLEQV
jgi:LacI family transcriptional regulator